MEIVFEREIHFLYYPVSALRPTPVSENKLPSVTVKRVKKKNINRLRNFRFVVKFVEFGLLSRKSFCFCTTNRNFGMEPFFWNHSGENGKSETY